MPFSRLLFSIASCLVFTMNAVADDRGDFFEAKIRPVLMGKCFTCHGGDKTASGFRVDGLSHLKRGGDYGEAVVPGNPSESRLLAAIRYAGDLKMPPKERLAGGVVADFEKWIADGAYWPESTPDADRNLGRHWAFQPLDKTANVASTSSAPHPIDSFLDVALTDRGLIPLGQTDRLTLIRRASFDLIGLPPTSEQVREFMSDQRPDAFARLVDRMLESPSYAERWARHWLDLVRYADTAGDDSDYPIPQAALYRDYVIASFATDKPYDDFIREQIAGDILANDGSPERFSEYTIATGFLAQAKRFGTGKHEDMHLIIEDTLHTIGQTFLGLTFRCARCHDHKYDPTTQEDYYALYGVFESTVYPHPGGESERQPSDLIPLANPAEFAASEATYREKYGPLIDDLEAQIKQLEAETKDRKKRREIVTPLRAKLDEIRDLNPWETTPLAYAVKEGEPVDARTQIGGDPGRRADRVPRGVPQFLAEFQDFEITAGQSGRLDLANWLASPDNPLTARVMANRIWQYHFGKGIVASPSNFGIQGDVPTHPELLDWLAARFIESGWSIKAMHRLIMSSAAYQRQSGQDETNSGQDPANHYYWRFDRRRLDAESIRDSMLCVAGNLNLCRAEPHPFPPTRGWRFSAHRQFKAVYPSNHRSIYLMVQRLHPHPFLSLFNGPNTTASVAVRDASTVPLQALFMANSQFVHTQAEGLAQHLIAQDRSASKCVELAYWMMFSRPPTDVEFERGVDYVQQYRGLLAAEGVPPDDCEQTSLASLVRTLFASNEFVYVD